MSERDSKRDINRLSPKEIQPWELPRLSDEKFVEFICWQMAEKFEELGRNGQEIRCKGCSEPIKNPENLRRLLGQNYEPNCFQAVVTQFSDQIKKDNDIDRLIDKIAQLTVKLMPPTPK